MFKGLLKHFNLVNNKISNGFNTILNYQKGETCCVGLFIKTGSRQEEESNNGVSHFLEHMYFKGTDERTPPELEDLCEGTGCFIAAHTSREYTTYSVHCLKENVDLAVDILSDMILNARILKSEIEKERGTIVREYEEVNSIVEEFFFDVLHEICYPDHPLGFTILGSLENIEKNLTQKKMRNFRKNFYNTDNMVLVGVGDIDEDHFIELSEQYFSSLPSSSSSSSFCVLEEPERNFRYGETVFVDLEEEENSLVYSGITYEGPGFDNRLDLMKLNLLQTLIGWYDQYDPNDILSPLSQSILQKDVSSEEGKGGIKMILPYCLPYTDCSLFGIKIVRDGQPGHAELVNEISEEFNDYIHQITQEEFDKAKDFMILQSIYFLENSLQETLDEIGRNFLLIDDEENRMNVGKSLEEIEKITIDDLKEFYDKYISSKEPVILHVGNVAQIQN